MRILYFDCQRGAAGDMLAGALLGLVPDPAASLARLNALGLPGVEIRASAATRRGIAGTLVDVFVGGGREAPPEPRGQGGADGHRDDGGHHGHGASLAEVRARIEALPASQRAKNDARAVYDLLAAAEAKAHGRPVDQVHFHEVGALDALADIVGVSLLLEEIAPDRILASAPNAGGGTVRCAHGILPVPAPATANLLEGLPWHGDGAPAGELLTPTGAALLRHFVRAFGPMPTARLLKTGYGLGHRDTPEAANVVRAFLAETAGGEQGPNGRVAELACNIDDMTGEDLGLACERIRAAGALDVSLAPLLMKKGRPGHLLLALAPPERADAVAAAILRETSTFGVRRTFCDRYELDRAESAAGGVRVKTGSGYGVTKSKPEYEDRIRLAAGRPPETPPCGPR